MICGTVQRTLSKKKKTTKETTEILCGLSSTSVITWFRNMDHEGKR